MRMVALASTKYGRWRLFTWDCPALRSGACEGGSGGGPDSHVVPVGDAFWSGCGLSPGDGVGRAGGTDAAVGRSWSGRNTTLSPFPQPRKQHGAPGHAERPLREHHGDPWICRTSHERRHVWYRGAGQPAGPGRSRGPQAQLQEQDVPVLHLGEQSDRHRPGGVPDHQPHGADRLLPGSDTRGPPALQVLRLRHGFLRLVLHVHPVRHGPGALPLPQPPLLLPATHQQPLRAGGSARHLHLLPALLRPASDGLRSHGAVLPRHLVLHQDGGFARGHQAPRLLAVLRRADKGPHRLHPSVQRLGHRQPLPHVQEAQVPQTLHGGRGKATGPLTVRGDPAPRSARHHDHHLCHLLGAPHDSCIHRSILRRQTPRT